MCGIVCLFKERVRESDISKVKMMAAKINHRGPDNSGIYTSSKCIMAHKRLAIMDPSSGHQPLISNDGRYVLAINGEIYNHESLRSKKYKYKTNVDCEVILDLFKRKKYELLNELNGIFAFVLYDEVKKSFFIARDHLGIIPLYMAINDDELIISSELKAFDPYSEVVEFPPGYCMVNNKCCKWYNKSWQTEIPSGSLDIFILEYSLNCAVKRQLMTDVPFGVLISGGLDSSIIASIVKKHTNVPFHSFSVGLKDSPDLMYAKKVSQYLGTIHHEVIFTIEEGLEALKDVIYYLETFDITTIRSSVPMYLMGKVIKSFGIKMVLSGEGSDEIFGGYLYFHKAPNKEEFHKELVRKLDDLHMYDCLRANKALMAHGIECRVPFLDVDFLDIAMNIDPKFKMIENGRMEKHILREAFEDYLPDEVVWRQKIQFSDGVGSLWINSLKKMTSEYVSDDMMNDRKKRFPMKPPKNKEEYYYRSIFSDLFQGDFTANVIPSEISVACSSKEAIKWDKNFILDPSGLSVII